MDWIESLKLHNPRQLGKGIPKTFIKDLEVRLNIGMPEELERFLLELNYATLYDDPIFGINRENPEIDLYERNVNAEHFRYGFLEIFSSDIDGAVYIRPDTGLIYSSAFLQPISPNFSRFVESLLADNL